MNNLCEKCNGSCCRCQLISDDWLQSSGATSVHYIGEGNRTKVNGYTIIDKLCPHLNEDGACDIYESRPKSCRDFLVGSEKCKIAMNSLNPGLSDTL